MPARSPHHRAGAPRRGLTNSGNDAVLLAPELGLVGERDSDADGERINDPLTQTDAEILWVHFGFEPDHPETYSQAQLTVALPTEGGSPQLCDFRVAICR